jgi:hypothetical protein
MPGPRLTLLIPLAAAALLAAPAIPASGDATLDVTFDAPPLPFFHDLYMFRGKGGRTDVVAAYAVPAGLLQTDEAPKGVRYRFDITLVLADTALRTVHRTDDSVFVELPRPLDGDHLLYTQVEVQAPPSRTTVERLTMIDGTHAGTGQLYNLSLDIPDFRGTKLMLSDIALGLPGARIGWKRGEQTIALLPTSQFPSSAFDVYYEIYNLSQGGRYTTEITIEDMEPDDRRGDDDRPVRLRFTDVAALMPDGTLPELRRVETSLPRGNYRITVHVTDPVTGVVAKASRAFTVSGWNRGSTMVAALPHVDEKRTLEHRQR